MKNPLIGIVGGRGKMGKLFAKFFTDRGIKVIVSDRGTKISNQELATKSDIVIISVPIDKTIQLIEEIKPFLKDSSALMDLTSIKEKPVKAMLNSKLDLKKFRKFGKFGNFSSKISKNYEVLGLHPMFGDSNPIPGQTVIFCPTVRSGKWSDWLENFFKKNQVNVIKMSAKEHDKIMSTAQALIHFAEISFIDALRQSKIPVEKIFNYCSHSSELRVLMAARVLAQDSNLYGNIQIQNSQGIKAVKKFKDSVEQLYKIIKKSDLDSFEKYFEKGTNYLGKYAKKALGDSSDLINYYFQPTRKKQKKKLPDKNDLAVLGPENTFSDLCAEKYLKSLKNPKISKNSENNKSLTSSKNSLKLKIPKKYFARTISEVFELVEESKVSKGLIPIENTLHGTINETSDNLFSKKVKIIKEIKIPIHHQLLVLPGTKKSQIKQVFSKQQALNQCKKYLEKHLPNVEQISANSTTDAAKNMLRNNDKSVAVIASQLAAKNLPVEILAENIEDISKNHTTFVLIEKGELKLEKKLEENKKENNGKNDPSKKIHLAFYFTKNAPGTLFKVFELFAKSKINLSKIESRPTKKKFGDYIFFLNFDGDLGDKKIQKTLKELQKNVSKVKILGTS